MTAYITASFTPKNPERLKEYNAKAASNIAPFKGEFLVKALSQSLDGKTSHQYQVIITFPTKELAENWYYSPEYQGLIELREQGMDSHFQLVG